MLFQRNLAKLQLIPLTLVNLAILLYFVIYPHLNYFSPNLKLISSTDHFLLSLFHALTTILSMALLTWLPDFHLTFLSSVIFTCFTVVYSSTQCLGISLHQSAYRPIVGFCRHFKPPHCYMTIGHGHCICTGDRPVIVGHMGQPSPLLSAG